MTAAKVLPIRVAPVIIDRLDALVPKAGADPRRLAEGRAGDLSRSDVARMALVRGLEALEKEYGIDVKS